MWGFERLLAGPEKGGYSHVSFVRGQPALCRYMKRLKIKGTGNNNRASSPTDSPPTTKALKPVAPAPLRVVSSDFSGPMLQPGLQQSQTHPSSTRNAPFLPSQISQQQQQNVGGADLFDEDTLLSVLSSVLENPANAPMNTPHEGDCVLFEGMQFFFVEETGLQGASRRMSIELSRGLVGAAKRRLSLVGAQGMGNQHQAQQQRAARRFSLQRSVTNNNDYVLTQIVGI